MILLDTHIWVWWVHDDARLTPRRKEMMHAHQAAGIRVSAISCWEIAKLAERGRLKLPCPIEQWFGEALAPSGVALAPLTPEIAIASTRLGADFPRDPADQIIAATARVLDCPLVTADERITESSMVRTLE